MIFRPSFGIAFDIDGVILRGRLPIGGSPQALRRLYGDSASSITPFYNILFTMRLYVYIYICNNLIGVTGL